MKLVPYVPPATPLTLGLDLGPSSIGWALVNEDNGEFIATGVRVFPEGVDRDTKGGEMSKSQGRREARGRRRQVQRRARRLRILRRALVEAGLLPEDPQQQEAALALDPFDIRKRALEKELSPVELGRLFYHLGQRRGFLSNRKADRGAAKEQKGLLGEIENLSAELKELGSDTLGELLAHKLEQGERARGRHTSRKMYQNEFDKVWDFQTTFHPQLLTAARRFGSIGQLEYPRDPDFRHRHTAETHLQRYGLHGLIFFQRRIYWDKATIGKCELEPREKRCHRAERIAQRFRILLDVNNLRYINPLNGQSVELNEEQRASLADYLSTAKERSFEQIRKHLGKLGVPATAVFNLERGERSKLKGHETDAALANVNAYGKGWWKLDEEHRNRIVRVLQDTSRSDEESIEELVNQCGCSPDEAGRVLGAAIPDGQASLSRTAMQRLLPYIEQGMPLLGTDASNSALHAAGYLGGEAEKGKLKQLGPVPDGLTNPIVKQATFEVRKVVNSIIREYGMPAQIRIELAREAKKSFEQRQEIVFDNARRRKEREAAVEEMAGIMDATPKRNDILRYRLWLEAERRCMYCGETISQQQIASGEANVDHILPRWRSLDDSYMNKIISHRQCNADKGDRTPFEWLAEAQPAQFEAMLARTNVLPYPKRERFSQRDLVLDEFINRHLSDTTYITRLVKDYLQTLGVPVDCVKGSFTAELRHFWGLNGILNIEGANVKNRDDHRHHAVDAAVIALSTRSRLRSVATERGQDNQVDPPWPGFREELERHILSIVVSHRVRRGISGALHEETFRGATQKLPEEQRVPKDDRPWARDWREEAGLLVVRVPVAKITGAKQLEQVRDTAIRETLRKHLLDRGADPDAKAYPKKIFEGDNEPRMASGTPIRNVRIVGKSAVSVPVSPSRAFQYVIPGNNHHISYYRTEKNGKEVWTAQVTSMWDQARQARGMPAWVAPAIERPAGELVMTLSIGESFLVTDESGGEHLLTVRKIDSSGRMHFRPHNDARVAGDLTSENLYFSPVKLQEWKARKVTVDPLGRIRHARD